MYPNGFNVDSTEARPVQRSSAIRNSFKQTIDVNNPQPVSNRLRPLQSAAVTTVHDFCPFQSVPESSQDNFTNVIPLVQWSERKLAEYIDYFGDRPVGAHKDLFEQAWNIYLANQHRNVEDTNENIDAVPDEEPILDIKSLLIERGNLVRRMMEIDMIVTKAKQEEHRNAKA